MTTTDYNKFWSPAFDGMDNFVFLLDEDFHVVKASQSFLKFIGKNESELVGKKCHSIVHNTTKPLPECPHQKMLKSKTFESGEFFDSNLKKWLSVTVTPIFDEDSRCIGSIHIASDVTERKRMEEVLKKSEERYRTLVEAAQEGIGVVDPEENFIFVNPAFAKMLGYKESEMIGKNLKEFTSKNEFEKYCMETSVRKKGKHTIYETFLYHKTGEARYLTVSASPLWDNGNFKGTLGVVSDITERKKIEKALEKSEEKYRNLVENINHVFFVLDKKARFVHMNRAGLKSCGYKDANALQGRSFLSCVQKKYHETVATALKEAWRGKSPQCQYEVKMPKRTYRWWNGGFIPMSDDAGKVIHVIGLAEDVTEQKKATRIMKFYKEYAENIVLHLPVSILVVNRDLCINFANQHFLSKMRVTREDVTERELARVMGKSLVEDTGLGKKIMQVIKGEGGRIEDRFAFKGKTFDYMIVPLKEQTGRRRNALLVMEDVTKNVVMEEQLIHAEKLSAVGTFTASIAHEINNPLSIVVGNIQYLLSNIHHMNLTNKKGVGEVVETLKAANGEAKRCAEIVTNLLHFSHKGGYGKTKLSVNSVVAGTMKLLGHQLGLSKVGTIIKLADGLPLVMGNADHLQQAFVNLVLNAQQVMREGGKLHVTTSLGDNYVTVSFRDTGPGIPKKYVRKIFEPFYSTREAGKGTGLGLFIVHSIMEEHGGEIEVQSKRGRGATFILKFPAVKKGGWFGGAR